MTRHVLISGAGIAGPALAWWLARGGWHTTIVERAPALRTGGQAVDFRGPVHRQALEAMGLWDAIHERQTHLGEHALLRADGTVSARLPPLFMSGDVEILRGDLVQLLFDRTKDTTDYRFGDAVRSLRDVGAGVEVEFERGATQTFDLVVAADGLRSHVRRLAFGPHAGILRHHGYRVIGCSLPNVLGLRRRGVTYSEPNRGVCVTSARDEQRSAALFVHAGPAIGAEERRDPEHVRAELLKAFSGMRWEVPRLLDEVRAVPDLYFDDLSTVHVDRYARGRIVLLGDAAWGGTLGGHGASLALVGAYVLGGELTRGEDGAGALARYERLLRPYAESGRDLTKSAGRRFFAPPGRFDIAVRDLVHRMLCSRLLLPLFERLVTERATGFELPQYA